MSRTAGQAGIRTFTIIWFGQLISNLGSGLTGFGLGVYLFTITGSAAQFAYNSLLYVLTIGLVQLVAGALVDRWDRRAILIVADTGQACVTLAIAALLSIGQLAPWHIYVLTIVGAGLRAFQGPAYDASVALLVPERHLGRAAGMAQVSQAVSTLITPTLAGVLVLAIGLSGIVLIDLATFLVAIGTLVFAHIPNPERRSATATGIRSIGQDIAFSWRYLIERRGLLGLNVVSFAHDFLVNATLVLTIPMMLLFANAGGAGTVQAAGGAGLLLGSLLMSIWGGPRRRVGLYLGAVAFDGFALILAGWFPSVLVIAIARFLLFLGFSVYGASLRPLLQSKVALELQGRVFAAIGALAMLTEAPAYPIAGLLADSVFEPLMAPAGVLAPFFGPLIGAGPGRGMGLWHIFMGVCLVLTAIAGSLYPPLRRLEDEPTA